MKRRDFLKFFAAGVASLPFASKLALAKAEPKLAAPVAETVRPGGEYGVINFYSGMRPLISMEPIGELMATLSFGRQMQVGRGAIDFGPAKGVAQKSGTATWARVSDAQGKALVDFDLDTSSFRGYARFTEGGEVKVTALSTGIAIN